MNIDDFDYRLPEHLIADRPSENRTDSRLMVIHRDAHRIEHNNFKNLSELLDPSDLLVLNDTKVIPARLYGKKRGGGAKIEILLLEEREPLMWEGVAQRAIRLSEGTVVEFGETAAARVVDVQGEGKFLFRFDLEGDWEDFLEAHGEVPLPPYVLRARSGLKEADRKRIEVSDQERYQTVYAESPGSSAAPTAGLHFDEDLFDRLAEKGIDRAFVTLHVGLDTFCPVTVSNVKDHQMHSEWCNCPKETRSKIQETKDKGGKVIAVGTTSCRTLESYSAQGWPEESIRTRLFMIPGYDFQCVDCLLTNFHLPRSTLLMLVSAFMGMELWIRAYEEAIREGYRFYSYGDAMLIL